MLNDIILGFLIVVLLSTFSAFFFGKKSSSIKDFFYGGDNLKISWIVHLLTSTSFSLNGIIYQTYLGYRFGWPALIIQLVWCSSYILLSARSEKIISFERNGTLHGTISKYFSPNVAKIAALTTVVGFSLQVGWELAVGANAFSIISPDNKSLITFLIFGLAIIGAFYTYLGGLRGNIFANVIQNWIGGLAFVIIPIWLYFNIDNSDLHIESILTGESWIGLVTEGSILVFLSNILFSLVWQFVDMSTWHTIISGKNDQYSPKKALRYSALTILIFPGIVGTLLGVLLSNHSIDDPNLYISSVFNLIRDSKFLLIFFSMGCISAMLSTLDGLLLGVGQVISWDFMKTNKLMNYFHGDGISKKEENEVVDNARLSLFIIALISSGLIYVITQIYLVNIFDIVYIVTVSQVVLVPVVFLLLFKKKTTSSYKGAFIPLFIGFVAGISLTVYFLITGQNELLVIVPLVSFGLSTIISIFTIKKR